MYGGNRERNYNNMTQEQTIQSLSKLVDLIKILDTVSGLRELKEAIEKKAINLASEIDYSKDYTVTAPPVKITGFK